MAWGGGPNFTHFSHFFKFQETCCIRIPFFGNGVDQLPKFCRAANRAETCVSSALGHAELESDLI